MSTVVSTQRWTAAQMAELGYWRSLDLTEVMRICAEKPAFLGMLGQETQRRLIADREVLEIGCGPLGISIISFSRYKSELRRLVKSEPLPQLPIMETRLSEEGWATPFSRWVEQLAAEGEYLQTPGEDLGFSECFDTVVTYNVLDHVRDPMEILRNAFRALRPGGVLLVGVDCLSVLGRWRFDHLTRRLQKGSVLVEAHPHTFRPAHVERLIREAGFGPVTIYGAPGRLRDFLGSHVRPAFMAAKLS